ncbi:hypothetical protein [Sulfurisoma sediminicola]|uniref:Uncharacterized protein n=1 Tax=Sulfurisoma sediminicola TaxID=1381557 RepID=A0A497XDY6_9PROT|nr:hypothetical protein [Sulfurisoma sediminicola]RLJ64765.1 hypothetical protein DFR35_1411 [Sulfurisoma sediminicola]
MAFLKPKAANKTKTISVRVPIDLAEELDDIKRHADEHGLAFDVADVVERALTQAARSARSELAALPTKQQNALAA